MEINTKKFKELLHKRSIPNFYHLSDKLNIPYDRLSTIINEGMIQEDNDLEMLCKYFNLTKEDILIKKEKKQSITYSTKKSFIDVSNIKPFKQYKVLELFAGAGGLALGLEKAGFDSVGLIEYDKYACSTLRKNRPYWNVIEGDIDQIVKNGIHNYNVGEIDLLSGGFPCQAFSYAGKKLGLNDTRGTLFYYFAELLNELKPKVFVAENVRGLISHDQGKTLEVMLDVFKEVGYTVEYELLNAVHYNVAQKRERIFIIGVRNDLDIEINFPKPLNYILTLKDILKDVPPSPGIKYPESKKKILEMVPPGGCWRDLPENIAKEYMGKSYFLGGGKTGMARRLSWDEPSLTLTCSPAQKQTERCHPVETRPFTVREYARIQSFPDDWQFEGSLGQQYKQIGNAVPVQLAKHVGLALVNMLNQIEIQNNMIYPVKYKEHQSFKPTNEQIEKKAAQLELILV
ncbi:DNA cytosine methyltransferase [Tepidibacillus sp. HK-1]|nr:DNA cytosine methyltransferase [Tepidibacillus sp. HK-1]GBF11499.1 modification methylase HhaI [Tepidibacillus sp. HK-1]